MAISTKDFVTLVREQAAAIQGAARSLVDLTVGSILRAVIEANAAVTLWLQGLILHLLKTTRAATSTGADLDSWVEDYGLSRLPAVAATGYVTFSRFTPTQTALIPVGAKVQMANGVQHYAVVNDADHPAWMRRRPAMSLRRISPPSRCQCRRSRQAQRGTPASAALTHSLRQCQASIRSRMKPR